MTVQNLFYADEYTRRIAEEIVKDHSLKPRFYRLRNPTLHFWTLAVRTWISGGWAVQGRPPSSSILIGGNRWRHHFAWNLTDLPIIVLDAHTDMSYDEMIPLHLIRPYNWLYFRLLKGFETHLIIPYDSFRWSRWDIAAPRGHVDKLHLYAFNRTKERVEVTLSLRRSTMVAVKDPEGSPPMPGGVKQVSLDLDVVREVPEERVEKLLMRVLGEGDVCDIWLDEGRRGRRKTFEDHVEECSRIYSILDRE